MRCKYEPLAGDCYHPRCLFSHHCLMAKTESPTPMTIPEIGSLKCPDTGEFCHKTTCYNIGRCIVQGDPAEEAKLATERAVSRAGGSAGVRCSRYNAICHLSSCVAEGVCRGFSGNLPAQPAETATGDALPLPVHKHNTPKRKSCHEGMHKFGTLGSATLWLGARVDVGPRPQAGEKAWSLKICLIEGDGTIAADTPTGEVIGNRPARDLLPRDIFRKYDPTPILHIDWPDFGVPTMDRAWWVQLYNALAKINGNIAVYCVGGHGRTGTFASIIAALGGAAKGGDPVAYIRGRYCNSAVESSEQVEYIEAVTGATVSVGPRSYGGYSQGGWQGLSWGRDEWEDPRSEDMPHSVALPTLSRKRYKKWANKKLAAGIKVTPLAALEDQEQVAVNGSVFAYNADSKGFDFVGELADMQDGGAE